MHADTLEGRLPFWLSLEMYGTATALVRASDGLQISYSGLAALSDAVGRSLSQAGLVILAARNDVGGVATLVGLLRAGRPVLLTSGENVGATLSNLVQTYRPGTVVLPNDVECPLEGVANIPIEGIGYRAFALNGPAPVHPDLCLMILTSGSLGSPRAVRLSWRNLATSAAQVQKALSLATSDRAPLHLPLHYVYGLSVLASQLRAGGAVLVGMPSLLDRSFWQVGQEHGVTILPGVSFTYDMLRGLGERWRPPTTLRKLTHSGDRLSQATIDWALDQNPSALGFQRMYGMSEACSRMAVLPVADFRSHPHSVGVPVAMGRFALTKEAEIVYIGPNVMIGYASDADDLRRHGDMNEVLHTGDLGHLDGAGRLYISGRISRIAKIMGVRVSLDDIEAALECHVAVVAQATDAGLTILHEPVAQAEFKAAVMQLARRLRVPPQTIRLEEVDVLARNAAGKLLKTQPGHGFGQ